MLWGVCSSQLNPRGDSSGQDSPGILTEVQVDEFVEQGGEEADEEGHGGVGEERGQQERAQPWQPPAPGPAGRHRQHIPAHPEGFGEQLPIPNPSHEGWIQLQGPEADPNPSGGGKWIPTAVLGFRGWSQGV